MRKLCKMRKRYREADGRPGRNNGPRATIRDIADAAGVSIATVSRVLNGRPDVSPGTREAVLRVVRDQGFSMNRSARALSAGRTGLIGVTLPIVHVEYFSRILWGASEALYEHDMRVVLCPTMHERDREVTLLEQLLQGTTDGALLLLTRESNDALRALERKGFPFVVLDPRYPVDESTPVVSAAHWAGAKAATEHLLSLGHRRIGAITGPHGWVASVDRLDGYQAALAAAGVLADPDLIAKGNFTGESGRAAASRLLSLEDPPTAIFAFNDEMAVGAMRVAEQRGLRLPEELSIVGFDDLEKAEIVTPALTTVRQPLAEMGRMAVSLLTRLVEDQPIEAMRVELATKLIVRDSTAPPRG
jgi:LacI family transcriptional regulator, galactose operon repressor